MRRNSSRIWSVAVLTVFAAITFTCGDDSHTPIPDSATGDGGPGDANGWPDSTPRPDGPPPQNDGPPAAQCTQDYCVDPENGDDTNGDGTAANPYRSITMALSVATANQSIGVWTGTCNMPNGEQFPLTLHQGTVLRALPRGTDPTIIMGGAPTFICADGAHVRGFEIRPTGTAFSCQSPGQMTIERNDILPTGQPAITVETDSVLVELLSNWFAGTRPTSVAVQAVNVQSQVTLDNNVYSGDHGTALDFAGAVVVNATAELIIGADTGIQVTGPVTLTARACEIREGLYGVLIDQGTGNAVVDLGTSSDAGLNTLVLNLTADLCLRANVTVDAVGNTWDATQPSQQASCDSGVDIGNEGSGSVVWQ